MEQRGWNHFEEGSGANMFSVANNSDPKRNNFSIQPLIHNTIMLYGN